LITKADGTKFGKSEGGNICWMRIVLTPYKFYLIIKYPMWMPKKYIKIFTFNLKEVIEALIVEHKAAHFALLFFTKKTLVDEVTTMAHSVSLDLENAPKLLLFYSEIQLQMI
jgi:tyrosyl-tRNA synthetase